MAITLAKLREIDVPAALQFISEAEEWSPCSQTLIRPEEVLAAPNSHWLSAVEGERFIGIVGFTGINWPDRTADVALGVEPNLRKRGVARLLAQLQNTYAFKELDLRRLQMIALDGSPSCKIAQRVNFTRTGIFPKCRLKGGKYLDAHVYTLLRED